MSVAEIFFVVLIIGIAGFFLGRVRGSTIEKRGVKMHSRPNYYGWLVCILVIIPSFLFLPLWNFVSNIYLERQVFASIHIETLQQNFLHHEHSSAISTIRDIAKKLPFLDGKLSAYQAESYISLFLKFKEKGITLAPKGEDFMIPAAVALAKYQAILRITGSVLTICFALTGLAFGYSIIQPQLRARNYVERCIILSLILASVIAILITISIILSLLFQTVIFFRQVSFFDFLFGTVWDPHFSGNTSVGEVHGQFGLIPLLTGTLYIAFVAMLFAAPVGLLSAIYMAEYATPRIRGFIKPFLEILAGIPSIVYGFFALVTVGPFLRDLSFFLSGGRNFIMAQSVLTAGIVMGIMLVPFVSSLSNDIISSVPRTLRDGSFGLGATRSETIKYVVLPAALPGITAALLLATSRAIGETMIVVLAAGVAANLALSPFESMTTITVKIVNQLTGDLEFDSPQTQVAFALGITLFFLTLLMNIFALYIVRKYQEQYE